MPLTQVHPPGIMIQGVSVEIKIRGGWGVPEIKIRRGRGAPEIKIRGGGARKVRRPTPHYFLNEIALTMKVAHVRPSDNKRRGQDGPCFPVFLAVSS